MNEPPDHGEATLDVVVDLAGFPAIATLVVEVTAEDIDPTLVFNLRVDAGIASGTITVPAGSRRTVTVRAFDRAGIETHRGSTTVDIEAGENPTLILALDPLTGDLPIDIGLDTLAIVITPPGGTLPAGDTLRLTATVVTSSDDTLDVAVTWATGDPAVATVDTAGLVTAVAPGEAVIVATYAGRAAVASITVVDAVVTLTAVAPLVYDMQVDVAPAAAVAVQYWTGDEPRLRVTSEAATTHRIPVTRLLPDTTYRYALSVGDRTTSVTGEFRTGSLPADLEAVELISTGRSTAPLVMLELRVPTFQGFAAVDSWGRVVWFHRTAGSSWGWTRRANGNFVFLDTSDGLSEVTPRDEVVANLPRANGEVIHHDVIATPQNTLYFMTRHAETVDGTTWTGEMVWEWNPDTDELVARWNAFDFLSPAADTGALSRTSDWLHTNSISIGVSGNVLISSAFLSQVWAMSPDFSAIAWRLGGPNATVVPDSAATFEFQHTAAEIGEGRVLLFDNRGATDGPAPYSRALELELDFANGTATTAWVFRPPNDNYASIISSARRMANGNTMVAFGPGEGLRGSTGPIEVYEVTRDGRIVWHLVVTGPDHMFRATPFNDIAGETQVRR